MDPRFPEKTLPRLKELLKQFERVKADMEKTDLSSTLAGLEREGVLVVQEIALVAPRLHEYVMQISRNRRTAITRGLVEKPAEKNVTDAAEIKKPAPKKKATKKAKK